SSGSEFQSEGRLLVEHLAVNISALKLGKQTQISSVKRLYHLFPPERRQFEAEYFV
ncbi:hypothetical protein PDJAM_G00166980, partial [Pangasius djambal]|nr:hypothetical protein [Pangasius djambal]